MASVVVNTVHMVLISVDKITVYKLGVHSTDIGEGLQRITGAAEHDAELANQVASNAAVYRNEVSTKQHHNTTIVYNHTTEPTRLRRSEQRSNISLPAWCKISKAGDGKDDGTDRILASAFSSSGKYFAVCDDHKRLAIWNVEDSWKLINTTPLPRRATALLICEGTQTVLVADKSGDVHRFSISSKTQDLMRGVTEKGQREEEEEGVDSLVMGHVSMLLDLKLVADGKLLVTCDRDEKIRVSHYPNSYNIQSFCLGHTDFVSKLSYVEDKDLLISGSGDGTVRLWEYKNGHLLHHVDCAEILNASADLDPSSLLSHDDSPVLCKCNASEVGGNRCRGADVRSLVYSSAKRIIAVSFESRSTVLLFQLNTNDNNYKLSYLRRLQTSAPVWDLAFVGDHDDLLVVQAKEGAAVVTYRIHQTDTGYIVALLSPEDEGSTPLLQTTAVINQDNSFFKDCYELKSEASKLHKVHIDNMKEYIQRKKSRIQPNTASSTTDAKSTINAGSCKSNDNNAESCESRSKKIKFTELLLT